VYRSELRVPSFEILNFKKGKHFIYFELLLKLLLEDHSARSMELLLCVLRTMYLPTTNVVVLLNNIIIVGK